MQNFLTSPAAIVQSLISNRLLVYQMTKREVVGRYQGAVMGLAWSFINPILMLAVYTFVFSQIFGARWGAGVSQLEFASILFAGLIVYQLFSECLMRSTSLVLTNVNYVKKVIFPLEILPWVSLFASLFHALINVVVLVLFYLIIHGSLSWTAVFVPLILIPLLLMIMGVSWFLASVGVYIRDMGQIVAVIVTAMMFLSPVFYPASAFPESFQTLFYLNPLTFIIEQVRDVVLWGKMPDWEGMGIYLIASVVVGGFGFAWFQKTRKGFADVI